MPENAKESKRECESELECSQERLECGLVWISEVGEKEEPEEVHERVL